jgi:hypothetical protein
MPDQPHFNPLPHSDPPAGPYADSLAPQPPPADLHSDITDELTDHLALSARDLQLASHTPDEAQKLAHQKFGNIATIRRRLWWIQKGDEIMLRATLAVVLVVLVLAVAALGIGGWQISRTMNELGETLATMNETQRALLANRQQGDRPLAIRGRLYLGDKSKPASYASVDVYSLPEGNKVDTLMADEQGRFSTSSSLAGHYTILAPLIAKKTDQSPRLIPDFFAIQSRPISVYPWSKDTTIELDVAMVDYGQVSVELATPFPRKIELTAAGKKIMIRPSLVVAIPIRSQQLPIQRHNEQDFWPIVGLRDVREQEHNQIGFHDLDPDRPDWEPGEARNIYETPVAAGRPFTFCRVLPLADRRRSDAFRAGSYRVEAYVYWRVVAGEGGSPFSEATQSAWRPTEIDTSQLLPQSQCPIEVVDGRRAHLLITPPKDLEKSLREELSKILGDANQILSEEQNARLLSEQRKARPVKLEFAGQRELIDLEKRLSR